MSPLRRPATEAAAAPGPDPSADVEERWQAVCRQLVSGEAEDRRAAAADLVTLMDEGDRREQGLRYLVERVVAEPDPSVRDTVLTQLTRYDEPVVVDGLIAHLASDDATLRNRVAEVLSELPRSLTPRVPVLLADPDPDVRILTVMVLGGLRTPEVEDWLAEVVLEDASPDVTAAAMGELVTLGGPRVEEVLGDARARFPDDPFIAFVARRAATAGAGPR